MVGRHIAEHRFDNPDMLADRLAQRVADSLANAAESRGTASMVVPAGRTPGPFFDRLSRAHLPWERVYLTVVDERCQGDGDSHDTQVRQRLVKHGARRARFTSLRADASAPARSPEDWLRTCHERLLHVPRPFDVVILGMDAEGHAASWLPGSQTDGPTADELGPLCSLIRADEENRVTLSPDALLRSRRVVLHFTGAAKWRAYEAAREPGEVGERSARHLLHQHQVPVEVWWSERDGD